MRLDDDPSECSTGTFTEMGPIGPSSSASWQALVLASEFPTATTIPQSFSPSINRVLINNTMSLASLLRFHRFRRKLLYRNQLLLDNHHLRRSFATIDMLPLVFSPVPAF
ncbi:hypothetical protein Q1695_008354 [Nippostrongylus brasiliensis]|nr:hypothetical protein Q1695_008354 [Nippostrongylus brasiliensis]